MHSEYIMGSDAAAAIEAIKAFKAEASPGVYHKRAIRQFCHDRCGRKISQTAIDRALRAAALKKPSFGWYEIETMEKV